MLDRQPLFSVVIPTYNRAQMILVAIQSVLDQSFQEFELIVVDDGSTDSTRETLERLVDHRVRYLRQTNRGRSVARNIGASVAQGRYLVFLDSDDEVLPMWLERLASAIHSSGVAVVCCGAYVLSDTANQHGREGTIVLPKPMGAWYRNVQALFAPPGTFAIRRDVFFEAGGYALGMEQSENTELGRRVVEFCNVHDLEVAVVGEPLIRYHRWREFSPSNVQLFWHLKESNKYMLRKHEAALRSASSRYAYSCGIVGVNAARLGNHDEARRFFWLAVQSDPWHWKHYARFAIAVLPGISERFWLRSQRHRRTSIE